MTYLQYGDYIFADVNNEIYSESGCMSQALLMNSLSADEFECTVDYDYSRLGYWIQDTQEGSDYLRDNEGRIVTVFASGADSRLTSFENFVYGTPLDWYENNVLRSRFYVTNIAPVGLLESGAVRLKFTAVSWIGLMVNQNHNGGYYFNSNVGNIVADLLNATLTSTTSGVRLYTCQNGWTYTMDETAAVMRIDNVLPIASVRDNLRDVLFVSGVSILKNANGSPHFTINQPDTPVAVDASDIYMGDVYGESERVTKVVVIEHSYLADSDTEDVLLYDTEGIPVTNYKVTFNEPCHSLSTDDSESLPVPTNYGANYAIISGSGKLYGKPYIHTQRELSASTGLTGPENIKTTDNTLVSSLNSEVVLARMKNYYKNAKTVNNSIVLRDNVKTGSLISFLDPLGRTKIGYISRLSFTVAGIIKANANIITNWVPSDVGPGYTKSVLLTGSGTFNPADYNDGVLPDSIKFAIIGGGGGGQGGYYGGDGTNCVGDKPSQWGRDYPANQGGDGGSKGACGYVGKLAIYTIDNVAAQYAYNCGTGGAGGAGGVANSEDGKTGTDGTASTINDGTTTWSSANGTRPNNGYMNLITGVLYATKAPDALDGVYGQGLNHNEMPGSITYNGQTWVGGSSGEIRYWSWYDEGGVKHRAKIQAPGGGGGCAYGANGYSVDISDGNMYGAQGATALQIPYTPPYGGAGIGGCGGGGGGASGIPPAGSGAYSGYAGSGGNGSAGGTGGNGLIIVYM